MDKRILVAGCDDELRIGTDFIDKYPKDSNVLKVDLDNERFPYEDDTFDDIYSRMHIAHLKNPEHFLGECYRVLKRDGRIYITTDNAAYYSLLTLTRKQNSSATAPQNEKVYHMFSRESLELWLQEAGFTDINVKYAVLNSGINNLESEIYKDILKLIDLKPHIVAEASK